MNAVCDSGFEPADLVVLPDPEIAWVGHDRLGNAIRVTRGAFAMAQREHVWELGRTDTDPRVWRLVADNISELSAASVITYYFGSAAAALSDHGACTAHTSGEPLEAVTVTVHCTQMPVVRLGEPQFGPNAADVSVQGARGQIHIGPPDGGHDLPSGQHAADIAE